ncbi:MAG: MBL fold metallo-hydrolase [Salinigranum sp.]
MKVAEDVFCFPVELERGGADLVVNPAGIETDGGLILLDTGIPGSLADLEASMAADGFGIDDVELLLLTHQDGDHAGAAAELVERTGATVFAHGRDAPAITGEAQPLKTRGERYPPIAVDVELQGGEVFDTSAGPAEVIPTPGHTPGHVSVYLSEVGRLIAADALTAEDGLAGPNEAFTPDMDTAVRSVYRLSNLAFDATLCYHGGFVDRGTDAVASIFDELRPRVDGFEVVGGDGARFLSRELETENVGLSRFVLENGGRHGSKRGGNTGHRHTQQEEVYLFLEGSGTMKIDDQEIDVEAGDAVCVEPYCFRAFEADDYLEFVAAGGPIAGDESLITDDFW